MTLDRIMGLCETECMKSKHIKIPKSGI